MFVYTLLFTLNSSENIYNYSDSHIKQNSFTEIPLF